MGRYYDKAGKRIGLFQWSDLFEDMGYRRVAEDRVSPDISVSTIWLGIDHRWGEEGSPLIFETAIFLGKKFDVVARYPTEADAVAGHCETLLRMKKATETAAKS